VISDILEHKDSLSKYPELKERMQSLLQNGEKITPKQWKTEIQSLQSECKNIGKEQTKIATELAYAEVISYNKKNLEREFQNESRQHNRQQNRTKQREEVMAKRTAKLFPAVFPACLQLFCRPVIMAGGGRNEIGAEIAGAIHINESGHPGDSCLFSNELLWNFFWRLSNAFIFFSNAL